MRCFTFAIPTLGLLRKDFTFKISLDNLPRSCLKNKKTSNKLSDNRLDMVAHTCQLLRKFKQEGPKCEGLWAIQQDLVSK